MIINPAHRRRRNAGRTKNQAPCCDECRRHGTRCTNPDNRQSNPVSTTALLIGGGVLAAGAGYLIYKSTHKTPYGQQLPPAQTLANMFADGEILAAAPSVVADVMQPIALSIKSPPPSGYSHVEEIVVRAPGTLNEAPQSLSNVDFGSGSGGVPNDLMWEGRLLDGTIATGVAPAASDKAIASLVTGVTGEAAAVIYEAALGIIAKYGADWDNGGQRDAMTIQILQIVVPGVDYSKGLQPYALGDDPSRFWLAVQLIGSVANQSYWNKQASA